MKCPNDETTLVMSDRNGIEIDYCPECRGVWLDRGELDKIVERSVAMPPPAAANYGQPYQQQQQYGRGHDRGGHDDRRYDQNGRGRRKESWLGDLFG